MSNRKVNKLSSDQIQEIHNQLLKMTNNDSYKTEETYAANEEKYPSHTRSFVEKHVEYLKSHPNINREHYIANLKLSCKIR